MDICRGLLLPIQLNAINWHVKTARSIVLWACHCVSWRSFLTVCTTYNN